MIKNAKIEKTMFGFEDHGILTCFLHLNYGGSSQGFGGYNLNSQFGIAFVKAILQTVGVEEWENLPGNVIRVEFDENGASREIKAIGNVIEEKWFYPKELAEKFERKND